MCKPLHYLLSILCQYPFEKLGVSLKNILILILQINRQNFRTNSDISKSTGIFQLFSFYQLKNTYIQADNLLKIIILFHFGVSSTFSPLSCQNLFKSLENSKSLIFIAFDYLKRSKVEI